MKYSQLNKVNSIIAQESANNLINVPSANSFKLLLDARVESLITYAFSFQNHPAILKAIDGKAAACGSFEILYWRPNNKN